MAVNKTKAISQAVALIAAGETQESVAKGLGVTPGRMSQIASQHKEAINNLAIQIIADSIQPIRDNHRDTLMLAHKLNNIALGKTPINETAQFMATLSMLGLEAKDILALADKKEHRALQIMGIMPSHTPSTVVNMLFNIATGPRTQELTEYREFLAWKMQQDVQEAEIVGESSKKQG